MEGTNLDCEQFKCCKLPHIKVWSQTKYACSHVSPTLISVLDLLQRRYRNPRSSRYLQSNPSFKSNRRSIGKWRLDRYHRLSWHVQRISCQRRSSYTHSGRRYGGGRLEPPTEIQACDFFWTSHLWRHYADISS